MGLAGNWKLTTDNWKLTNRGMILMRALKSSILAIALVLALAAPILAQTPPAGTPKPQTPPPAGAPKPQTPPPAGQQPTTPPPATPALKPQPPAPFPQDSKIAYIDFQQIAATSASGKEATKKLEALQAKKLAELQEKNKQLQALTTKRDQGGSVLNDTARAQLDKDIERLQREAQFAQTNAQAEMQDLQNELQGEFQKRLLPIIEELAKEKGLYAVFTGESGIVFAHPGLNLSDEVIKRLDAKKN
jgi:outer membrane protein